MQIRTGVYWSPGVRADKNEDSLSLQHVRLGKGSAVLAVVCDGVGSTEKSEEAGGFAVRFLTNWFYHEGKKLILKKSSKEIILLALQRQICQIQEYLQIFQQTQQLQTGTTLTALLLIRRRIYIVHIGDSRLYQIKKRAGQMFLGRKRQGKNVKVCQLTKDDVNAFGALVKCLGASGEDRAYFDTRIITKNRIFLLCTDGFYKSLDREKMGAVLSALLRRKEEEPERRLELLGEQAVRSGSRDNLSAVIVVIT